MDRSERIGFVAALATLKKMERKKVNEKLLTYGNLIKNGWFEISKKYNLKIKIQGMTSMPSFIFEYNNANKLYTYYTQEMLEYGFLASNSLAVTYSFNKKLIAQYLNKTEIVFKKMNFIRSISPNISRYFFVLDIFWPGYLKDISLFNIS